MTLASELRKVSRVARILIIDIETAPMEVFSWALFNQNHSINQIVKPGRVMCWAAQWYGQGKIMFASEHHDGHENMIQQVWDLLDAADIVVTYNGPAFDLKHLAMEFVQADMPPPSPHKDVDLLKVARQFAWPSRKLDYVSQVLGIGQKVKHEGMGLWRACLEGDDKAWARMRKYNKHDVRLTKEVYDRFGPWIKNHPHMGLWTGEERCCFRCGSTDLEQRGFARTAVTVYARLRCRDCGAWSRANSRKHNTTVRGVK